MLYLIDDDQYVRKAFGLLFRSAGLDHLEYGSALEFLEDYSPLPDDFLVLDVQMPSMSGFELLKHLAGMGVRIPVILITAFDPPYTSESSANYNVLACLKKPVDSDILIGLLIKATATSTDLKPN